MDGGVPRLTSTATVSVQVRPCFSRKRSVLFCSEAGVLEEHYSAKPAQRSSHTSPPLHRMDTVSLYGYSLAGLADYKVRLKLPTHMYVSVLSTYVLLLLDMSRCTKAGLGEIFSVFQKIIVERKLKPYNLMFRRKTYIIFYLEKFVLKFFIKKIKKLHNFLIFLKKNVHQHLS